MRLSRHSDYALRMLMHVALKAPASTTVGEVAAAYELSVTHLQKVAQTLAAHGYLQTVRGRTGGLLLKQKPELIRLGAVIATTEPDFQIAPCMSSTGESCPIYDPCLLRTVLAKASDAFLAELDKWTLADLVKKRAPLLLALQNASSR